MNKTVVDKIIRMALVVQIACGIFVGWMLVNIFIDGIALKYFLGIAAAVFLWLSQAYIVLQADQSLDVGNTHTNTSLNQTPEKEWTK